MSAGQRRVDGISNPEQGSGSAALRDVDASDLGGATAPQRLSLRGPFIAHVELSAVLAERWADEHRRDGHYGTVAVVRSGVRVCSLLAPVYVVIVWPEVV